MSDPVLEDEASWDGLTVNGDFAGGEAGHMEITACRLEGAVFTGASIDHVRMTDSVFERCELSGAALLEASIERVEFVACRLSGAVLAQSVLRDVRFMDCRLDGANFRMVKGNLLRFEASALGDADFYAAMLPGARFIDCDLTGVEFSKASLKEARLHGSTVVGIKGASSLAGVVIDSTQVLPLAHSVLAALDISIDDDRDPERPEKGQAHGS